MTEWGKSEVTLAFAQALGATENIARSKTADTGKYTYRYADLGDVLDEVKRVCGNFGLTTVQIPTVIDGHLAVELYLIHTSGEVLELSPLVMRLPGEPQAYGSALTYARRYQLLTVFGIAPEDDDGAAATTAAHTQPGRRTEAERLIRESIAKMDEDTQKRFTAAFRAQFGSGLSDLPAVRHGDALTWAREWQKEDDADRQFVAEAQGAPA